MNLCVEPFFKSISISDRYMSSIHFPVSGSHPGLTPYFFFATSAALVRCEMRFLKMSAVIENAIATIFD